MTDEGLANDARASESASRPPSSDPPRRRFALRRRLLFDASLIVAFGLAAFLVQRWREGQLEGYGLRASYFDGALFSGVPWRSGVEPRIDFSSERAQHFRRNVFCAEWRGTIVLPRSGRYVFATESDDGSWLEIDGKVIVDNGGIHDVRRVEAVALLSAGPRSIRVRYQQHAGGASIRLFWMPAGRRGGLEYIPPTLLLPEPPVKADVRRARAIPPRDLPALLLLSGLFVTLVLLLARRSLAAGLRRLRRDELARRDLGLFLLLFGAALGLRLWDLSGAGQTWDEDVYWGAGRNFVQNLLSADLRPVSWASNNEHPALAKWLYGPATLIADEMDPARAVAAVTGALTCAFLFLAGRDLVGRSAGFLGAALVAVLPHALAHSKVIGLEAPSGLFYTLAVWFFFRGLRRGGNTGYYLAAGLCAGLVVSTRVSNLSVFFCFGALYLVAHLREIRSARAFPVSLTLGLSPLLAAVVFFALWPYLWENPMQRLGEMLSHWKPDDVLEYFLGERREPPPYYFPLYFVVTTPVPLLAGLFLFFGLAGRRGLGHLALLLWWLAPFMVALSPMARDGVRYLYPALFPACLAAATGLKWLAHGAARLLRRPRAQAPLLACLGLAAGLYVLNEGLRVHPYYLDYYNRLVGGPERVARERLFEIAWWGEGLAEAARYIDRHAPPDASVWVYADPRHVVSFRPDIDWREGPDADFILYNSLFNEPPRTGRHRIAHVVRAGGAPLAVVYERDEERR